MHTSSIIDTYLIKALKFYPIDEFEHDLDQWKDFILEYVESEILRLTCDRFTKRYMLEISKLKIGELEYSQDRLNA